MTLPTLEQCRSKTVCCVRRVNGQLPHEWGGSFKGWHYVGRSVNMFHHGIQWPNSELGNPERFEKDATVEDKRLNLSNYISYLDGVMNVRLYSPMIEKFKSILSDARKMNVALGCWCLNWDGASVSVPLCHAAYLARAIDWLKMKEIDQVCVDENGVFYPNHTASPDRQFVVLRKPM